MDIIILRIPNLRTPSVKDRLLILACSTWVTVIPTVAAYFIRLLTQISYSVRPGIQLQVFKGSLTLRKISDAPLPHLNNNKKFYFEVIIDSR